MLHPAVPLLRVVPGVVLTLAITAEPCLGRSSLIAQAVATSSPAPPPVAPGATTAPGSAVAPVSPPPGLTSFSLFAIPPLEPRTFRQHDLIQIIVRESSRSSSKEKMDNKHDWSAGGELIAVPLNSLNTDLPARYEIETGKKFKGDGKFDRSDEVTARITAEVIEVLPNGNLVLEARSMVTTNLEATIIRLTGICRPDDISAANTILSSQVHDLRLEKIHTGDLRENGQRGILARVLDTIFAF